MAAINFKFNHLLQIKEDKTATESQQLNFNYE